MNELTPDEHRILVDAIHDSATVIHKGQRMNEQVKKLALKSGIAYLSEHTAYFGANDGLTVLPSVDSLEKFAELIVKECYQHCKDQLMDKKLAEHEGLDYNDGVMDCAIGLLQHFGVE